jgi:hypothetical protein
MKMPEPIMTLITTMVASNRFRPRTNPPSGLTKVELGCMGEIACAQVIAGPSGESTIVVSRVLEQFVEVRMKARILSTLAAMAAVVLPAGAQNQPRRAIITGGGNPAVGRCEIEVVVDGAAEVEIRGDNAALRNLWGQPPQWRRFQCTSVMPPRPENFRFRGVDGRGRQDLVQDPRDGRPAVVRIEDRQGGFEGYTFEISWTGAGGPPFTRGPGGRFTASQAIEVCQDAVREQAIERFRTRDVTFRRVNIDDNPGRRDWVVGLLDARPRFGPDRHARFSCSVDFDTGRVRSAQIEPMEGDRDLSAVAFDNCRRAVTDHLRDQGYFDPQFGRVAFDDRPGRRDWIMGDVRARGRNYTDSFTFSCSVNLENGVVRSADVVRR